MREKYLIFDSVNSEPFGVSHKLFTLTHVIREAIHLNRVLVLREFAIVPTQNFAYDQKTKEQLVDYAVKNRHITYSPEYLMKKINFQSYINLAKTKIYKLEDNRDIVEIKNLFRYIDEDHFDLSAYTDTPESITKTDRLVGEYPTAGFKEVNDQVLIAQTNQPISAEQNNQYQVIVRRTAAFNYDYGVDNLLAVLYPSDEIERLMDIVLRSMGTSLKRVKNRYNFYYGADTTEILNNYQMRFSQEQPTYYACLHVRANDRFHYLKLRYAAERRNVENIVGQAMPRKSTIYIMSDINDPHYFDFLRKDYVVYQYFDFPELKALVSCENKQEVDNAMLYSVEKNIFLYAHTKIMAARAHPAILYTNHSYRVPRRYRLMHLCRCLASGILKKNSAYCEEDKSRAKKRLFKQVLSS